MEDQLKNLKNEVVNGKHIVNGTNPDLSQIFNLLFLSLFSSFF